MSEDEQGVVFPAGPDGRRSTAALGRAVTADALRPSTRPARWPPSGRPTGGAATSPTSAASSRPAASATAARPSPTRGSPRCTSACGWPARGRAALDGLLTAPAGRALHTVEVHRHRRAGAGALLPFHGGRLRGDALLRRLDAWVTAGVVEPSCAEAVRTVAAHPEWLALPDQHRGRARRRRRDGPAAPRCCAGAPRWPRSTCPARRSGERLLDTARGSAGTLLVPVGDAAAGRDPAARGSRPDRRGARRRRVGGGPVRPAGARQLRLRRRATNVRVSTAVDALTRAPHGGAAGPRAGLPGHPDRRLRRPRRRRRALRAGLRRRSRAAKLLGRPLRLVSGGRLLQRATCPAPTRGSPTAWSRSRAPTTPWPSGCSGGGPRRRGPPGARCR